MNIRQLLTAWLILSSWCWSANAQTTAFTYQGKLTDNNLPANAAYDFQFKLFDAPSGGTQVGTTVSSNGVPVSGGVFTVTLDFGANAFLGAARFLEISLRPTVSGAFTTLNPRQPVTAVPYAIKSLGATAADGLTSACAGCVTGVQISSLPANSGNYIQNTTTPQATSNFNISGNGTAGGTLTGNIVNATTQFNLGGSRVLSTPGTQNTFAGVGAGQSTTAEGQKNAFFGFHAGLNNTGSLGVLGSNNAFFGNDAGQSNVRGYFNSYFGSRAGAAGTDASANPNIANSFFGFETGVFSSGNENSFVGVATGSANSGSFNAFFGYGVGRDNTGNHNTFIGHGAGATSGGSSNNTALGAGADAFGFGYATAIGAGAVAIGTNRVQLGRAGQDTVALGKLDPAATSNAVCYRPESSTIVLTACGSSLRYKDNIKSLELGLRLLQRLRPVTFNWKESHQPDLGLIAEEVAAVEPLLNTYNHKGELEGVKYTQLTVVLINAVKEQQAQLETQAKQIAAQQAQLKQQQRQLDALRKLICQTHPQAAACRE